MRKPELKHTVKKYHQDNGDDDWFFIDEKFVENDNKLFVVCLN